MKTVIDSLLRHFDIQPVLIDIGASGEAISAWQPLAHSAFYIGFDPDLREMSDTCGQGFARSVIINEAVAATESTIPFYLTHSPQCSSTLAPNNAALGNYLFADLFQVEREISVHTTTLNSVLDRLELSRIDWLKVDTQGTDLRIFNSINEVVRRNILCVDVEPGLIDAYQGEDLFIDTHREMTRQGFWLCKLDVHGNVRLKPDSARVAREVDQKLSAHVLAQNAGIAPGWVEARYLRSIDSIAAGSPSRDLVLLWIFSMLNGHYGFAFDIALHCEQQGKNLKSAGALTSPILETLKRRPLQEIQKLNQRRQRQTLLSPTRMIQKIRQRLGS